MAISWRDRDDKVKGGNEKIFHCEVSKRILLSFGKEVGPVEKEATTFNEWRPVQRKEWLDAPQFTFPRICWAGHQLTYLIIVIFFTLT